jgi:hypothetical protein
MLLKYFGCSFYMVRVSPIISVITFVFKYHMRSNSIVKLVSYQVAKSCKSQHQQHITAIDPSTNRMLCALLISVNMCSSVTSW